MNRIFTFLSAMLLSSALMQTAAYAQSSEKVQKCIGSKGVFRPSAYPQCFCDPAKGLFNIQQPGIGKDAATIRAQMNITNRAKERLDMCEPTDIKRTSENIRKPKGGDVPAAPSGTPFSARLTPTSSGEKPVSAGTTLDTSLVFTSTGKGVQTLTATCDGCTVNGQKVLIDTKVKKGPQAYPFSIAPSGDIATKGGKAVLTIEVAEAGSPGANRYEYNAEWAPKDPPAPVETACKKSGGTDSPNSHCYCPGDELEESKTAPFVCVKKTVAPAAVVKTKDGRDGSSRLHLRVDPFVGYAKSDDFKTAIFGLALGVSFDFLTNLSGYVEGGFQFPGATRTDSANRPVLLSDGSKDQRSNSLMVEAGVEFQAAEYVLLTGGVLFQALGVTAGQTNPVHSTLSTKFGVKVLAVQMPAFRLAIGPSVLMGVESRGNTPANFWFGGLLNVTAEFWNIIPWSK